MGTPEKPDNSILSSQTSSPLDSSLIMSSQPADEVGYYITSLRSMLSVDMSKCEVSEESDVSNTNYQIHNGY